MTSYHILSAVWISVFPLVAVAIILVVLCYLVCCLKRLKHKINERNKLIEYLKTNNNNNNSELLIGDAGASNNIGGVKESAVYGNSEDDYDYKKAKIYEKHDKNANDAFIVCKLNDIYLPAKSYNNLKELTPYEYTHASSPFHHYYDKRKKFKSLDVNIECIDQLEVQELNESPKSLYSKFQHIQQKHQQQPEKQQHQYSPQHDSLIEQISDLNKLILKNLRAKAPSPDETLSKTVPTTPLIMLKNENFNKKRHKKSRKYVKSSSKSSITSSSSSSSSSSSPSSSFAPLSIQKNKQRNLNNKLNDENSINKNKLKLKTNSKIKLNHKYFSDIDNEDDVIFNDDDSLSSTAFDLYNNNNIRNNINNTNTQNIKNSNKITNSSSTIASSHSSCGGSGSSSTGTIHNTTKLNQKLLKPNQITNKKSSVSSIEPDENILNDILIKSNTKIDKIIESD